MSERINKYIHRETVIQLYIKSIQTSAMIQMRQTRRTENVRKKAKKGMERQGKERKGKGKDYILPDGN
jgi:hypothetical protein